MINRKNRLNIRQKTILFIVQGIILLFLNGCMLGPDFCPMEAPTAAELTQEPMPEQTVCADAPAGNTQYFIEGLDIPAQWWELFQSEALNMLVEEALANSPTLAKAKAVLIQAQEDVNVQYGAFFPTVDLNASITREKFNFQQFGVSLFPNPPPFTLYNIGVSVSYTLDIFGGMRRELEALCAVVDYQRFEYIASQMSLAANVVTAAIKSASLLEQIETTESILTLVENQLSITQQRYQAGGVAELDVLSQQTLLEQTKASLYPLLKQFEQTRHQLAIYLGKTPSESEIPLIRLSDLQLPCALPLSLPSELVRQRPDIRGSEALLHQASANIGVAIANLFPQVTINGDYTQIANKISNLFSSQASMWSIGPSLTQPIFQGGALFAKKRKAVAAYEQALAAYHETVLQGFQNVADALKALEYDAQTLRANAATTAQAYQTFQIATRRYHAGGVGYLSLLDAQKQYYQAMLTEAQSSADRLADTAALFQALGGGWWQD